MLHGGPKASARANPGPDGGPRVWQGPPLAADDASSDFPSGTIDAIIADLGDWRGALLARLRELIQEAEPGVVEELKWQKASNPRGVPTWSLDGIICAGAAAR